MREPGDDDRTSLPGATPAEPAQPAAAPGDGATVIVSTHQAAAPAASAIPKDTGLAGGDASVLPVGSRLAEFEITRLIGQGGFGVVYEARDHALDRIVALKEYLPATLSVRLQGGTVQPVSQRQLETFELGLRSFINEARLLAQFDHPSLLKVYRFWQEHGTAYMAMPCYQGHTLRQALGQFPGGAPEQWLLPIVDGLTQALAVMHRANCYHRDIAPDNIILLEGSGRPVLLDFGAARRVITDKTQALTVILKPGYAPIEQYAETPDMTQGAWTDVYALAAVMYVAITGRPPPASIARMLSDGYAPLASDASLRQRYSALLLAAIDAGLAVRPEARPASMAAFRRLLGIDSGGSMKRVPAAPRIQPASSSPPAADVVKTKRGAGRAGRWTGIAMTVLALMAATGIWWALRAPHQSTASTGSGTVNGQTSVSDSTSSRDPLATGGQTAGHAEQETRIPPPPPPPRTPLESLNALAAGAASGFAVSATPRQGSVRIGKDALDFQLRSARAGYVYVYLLSSDGQLSLLFPNQLDKRNRIEADQTLTLPRAAWPMNAGGPPGDDHFAVLVSAHERDFSDSGLNTGDLFPQFSLPVLASLEAARGNGPTPLLGKPVCAPGTACEDAYGVTQFQITEQ